MPKAAIWGKFLRFWPCDFKSLAICILRSGALSSTNTQNLPRGPKDQKNSRFRSRLKISIEPPTAAQNMWGNRDIEIKIFELKDQKFRSRLKISIEIENCFDRWALWGHWLSEPFAIGPVQFRCPRGVAENSFTKPGFWAHFVGFS